ncbi:MAG: polyphosphate kinase 2 family protein [Gammaproteobacteria bacterium]|nr:polyphosphate kinase 2 family protein [Gammaproteobacteria bacterium]
MTHKAYCKQFQVPLDGSLNLADIDPDFKGHHENKAAVQDEIACYAKRMQELQYLLYAENRRSLLIVLQAMDAAGKDGTIRHVLGYMNPQGCRIAAFKVPSVEEAAHDFLWRVHRRAPARGEVVVFNRSHYEDVLVTRVHKRIEKKIWQARYAQINAFEKLLTENGTHILKFFLHISADEQLQRFHKRIKDPARHWKISESDYSERQYWENYQQAYTDTLNRCNTEQAPWYVIPANHKWFRNLAVSRIVVETLEGLNMQFPEAHVDIKAIRRKYHRLANGHE